MELFGIGPTELLLVFVLALIFIGPGKMPEVAASVGKALREFRAASSELTDALNAEIAEAERRKSVVAAAENGHGHSEAEAAQAEIVAQGEVDAPAAVEYASPETPIYQYESAEPAAARAATVGDVLDAFARQEAEAESEREAEEAARLAAIALERAIRNGVGPLPESLLLPSSDGPLTVVNPTEQETPELAAEDESPVADAAELVATDVDELAEAPLAAPTPMPDSGSWTAADASGSASPDGMMAETNHELLEASGAGQAEVH